MLRRRVGELEATCIRQEREAGDRMRMLERDLRLAKDEAEECRRIVSELEDERMALQERLQPQVCLKSLSPPSTTIWTFTRPEIPCCVILPHS